MAPRDRSRRRNGPPQQDPGIRSLNPGRRPARTALRERPAGVRRACPRVAALCLCHVHRPRRPVSSTPLHRTDRIPAVHCWPVCVLSIAGLPVGFRTCMCR